MSIPELKLELESELGLGLDFELESELGLGLDLDLESELGLELGLGVELGKNWEGSRKEVGRKWEGSGREVGGNDFLTSWYANKFFLGRGRGDDYVSRYRAL